MYPSWARVRDLWRSAILPRVADDELEAKLREIQRQAPPPVIWLLGKTGAGKTSIVRVLTGAQNAVIGDGYRPCTKFSFQYDFPAPEVPLIRFLDTRGLGDASYDAEAESASAEAAHMLLIVVRAMDHALASVLETARAACRARSRLPVVVAQTCLHEGYGPGETHRLPYPGAGSWEEVSMDLSRSLAEQRRVLGQLRAQPMAFVPVDFTLPEDDLAPSDYGRDALLAAIQSALPESMRLVLSNLDEARHTLHGLHRKAAQPHILAYSLASGALGAVPLPMAALPFISATQIKMIQSIASIYHQGPEWKRFLELAGAAGLGLLLRQGARELLKVIPGFGSAVSGLYAAAATYALGHVACSYYGQVLDGHIPSPDQIRTSYDEVFQEGMRLFRERFARERFAGSKPPAASSHDA